MITNPKHHVFDYILTSVFNIHLDSYSLLLLSNTSNKAQLTYNATRSNAILYLLGIKHNEVVEAFDKNYFGIDNDEYISNLLLRVFVARFGDSIPKKEKLIDISFEPCDNQCVFLACMYNGSLSFLDYVHSDICMIEEQMNMLCDVLDLYMKFDLGEKSHSIMMLFAESEYPEKCILEEQVSERHLRTLLACCYNVSEIKVIQVVAKLGRILMAKSS